MIGRICRVFAACREGRQFSAGRQVCDTLLLLLFGAASGVFSKFLDTTPTNVLPRVPDIGIVLGRRTLKVTALLPAAGIVLGLLLGLLIPFSFG